MSQSTIFIAHNGMEIVVTSSHRLIPVHVRRYVEPVYHSATFKICKYGNNIINYHYA